MWYGSHLRLPWQPECSRVALDVHFGVWWFDLKRIRLKDDEEKEGKNQRSQPNEHLLRTITGPIP